MIDGPSVNSGHSPKSLCYRGEIGGLTTKTSHFAPFPQKPFQKLKKSPFVVKKSEFISYLCRPLI